MYAFTDPLAAKHNNSCDDLNASWGENMNTPNKIPFFCCKLNLLTQHYAICKTVLNQHYRMHILNNSSSVRVKAQSRSLGECLIYAGLEIPTCSLAWDK
jgi:hypothetical protein